jgi:serine/threonine protein kinase
MLVKLAPLPTPHLAKLLATYEMPDPDGERSKQYYIMFECADSNLCEFWGTEPRESEEKPGDVARWVAEQCLGLAEGLHHIHDYKYVCDPTDVPLKSHGFHGDIKPDNILRYRNWAGHEDPRGILQITDFGISSFHQTSTAVDIKARILGHPYRPPESQLIVMNTTQSLDIWTLGCLYLDFLSWLVEGPSAFDRFETMREAPGLNADLDVYYYDIVEENNETVLSISKGVLEVSVTQNDRARTVIPDCWQNIVGKEIMQLEPQLAIHLRFC